MIKIKYITDQIFGEPGPTIYFEGSPSDFLLLSNEIHKLGIIDNFKVHVSELSFVESKYEIYFDSTKEGILLNKIRTNEIHISLDKKYWPMFIEKLMSVSYFKSHNYIDFDGSNFNEDANLIISSC